MNAAQATERFTQRLLGAGLEVDDFYRSHDGVGGSTFTLHLTEVDGHCDDPEWIAYADSMDHRWYLQVNEVEDDVLLPEGEVSESLTAIALAVQEADAKEAHR